jgi:hypothetical protein
MTLLMLYACVAKRDVKNVVARRRSFATLLRDD